MKVGPVPTEESEQIALMRWAEMSAGKWPELRMLMHIPNGGYRTPVEAARFKRMGVKPGVPDLFLPAPKGPYNGLWIELKRVKGGRVSDEQKCWIDALRRVGYRCEVCRSWVEASKIITDYLKGSATPVKLDFGEW